MAAVNKGVLAEDVLDRLAQRLAAIQDEQDRLGGIQAAVDQQTINKGPDQVVYEAGTGNLTETRMPASPGAKSPHDEQTIYYTTGANTEYPTCGEHPEWANLPCQTQPGAQPKDTSLPSLAVSTDTVELTATTEAGPSAG
jgi:hypothetical protein